MISFDLDEDRQRLIDFVTERRWITVTGEELPYPINFSVAVGENGRLVCTGLILGALAEETVAITSSSLRHVSISELLRHVTDAYDDPIFGSIFEHIVRDMSEAPPPPRVRGSLSDQHFEYVAAEYRQALALEPTAPMRELRRRLGLWQGREIPEPTARRWVQRARDKGLLGASHPGKAGEWNDDGKANDAPASSEG